MLGDTRVYRCRPSYLKSVGDSEGADGARAPRDGSA